MVKYIVGSPGRSGSIFVALTIARSLQIRAVMSNQEPLVECNDPLVYHSHDAQLQLDPDIVMLHIVRNSLFDEIISAVNSEHYTEWSNYTSSNNTPYVCDLEMFENKYTWHKYWHQAHRALTHYTNRQILKFEEFIGQSEVICNQLNIPVVKMITSKSPYSQDNILNIAELKEKFNSLESQPALQQWDAVDWKDLRAK